MENETFDIAGLESEVNNTTAPKATDNSNKGNSGFRPRPDAFNGWKDVNIKEVNPVELPLNNVNKVYTMYCDYRTQSNEIQEKLFKVLTLLSSKGYTSRIGYSADSHMAKLLTNVKDISFEYYIPFKKYNEDIFAQGTTPEGKLPFQISKYVLKNGYDKIPDVVRAFRANAVNLMLGRTCLLPTNFVVICTKCGTTKIDAKADFKKLDLPGCTLLVIKLANMLKVPVINVNSPTFAEDLKKVLGGNKEDATNTNIEKPIEVKEDHVIPMTETPKPNVEVDVSVVDQPEFVEPEPITMEKPAELTDDTDEVDLGF